MCEDKKLFFIKNETQILSNDSTFNFNALNDLLCKCIVYPAVRNGYLTFFLLVLFGPILSDCDL